MPSSRRKQADVTVTGREQLAHTTGPGAYQDRKGDVLRFMDKSPN